MGINTECNIIRVFGYKIMILPKYQKTLSRWIEDVNKYENDDRTFQ